MASTDPQPVNEPKRTFSMWKTLKPHIFNFLITILVDVVLPLVIYFSLQKYTKPVYALLAAGSPPLLMVIIKALLSRTFDALGFLVFVTFLISAIVAIITKSSIILLLEKSLVTLILSVIFTFTLIPFHCCDNRYQLRPLAYYLYQDLVPSTCDEVGLSNDIFLSNNGEQIDDRYARLNEEMTSTNLSSKEEVAQVYQWIYRHCASFRLSCYLITTTWAIGYFLEFLARITLIVLRLPVSQIVLYGHIILTSITIFCIALSLYCIKIVRRHPLVFIERWNLEHERTHPRRSIELPTTVVHDKTNI